jgi:hypothetical protein
MPARRRAPQGCRLSELQISMSLFRTSNQPESRRQNVKLFLRRPLIQANGLSRLVRSEDGSAICLHPKGFPESVLDFTSIYDDIMENL